ncbi:uncharacterized protein FA14DRAFT_159885 [Meira miltonrushii]|uniref:DUF4536 domain-containing protein n=1 Tax=Meira miltonrushii TaxID=1280837 RepID=A0A316VL84_9BASI|nr:uncharacterized protein FA14DRAFT_159885 [Meira miltonrushii]PWN38220.1 hypothetical protein FA14DRAFT_159885 [Meira miltonrushii]
MLFSPLESNQKGVRLQGKEDEPVATQQDCLSCRLIGFATCLTLSGFCFTEAFKLRSAVKQSSMSGRMPPSDPKAHTPMPSIKLRSNNVFKGPSPPIPQNVRLRYYSFIVLGTGTSFAGIYRLIM